MLVSSNHIRKTQATVTADIDQKPATRVLALRVLLILTLRESSLFTENPLLNSAQLLRLHGPAGSCSNCLMPVEGY
jgi:hypothetical protein